MSQTATPPKRKMWRLFFVAGIFLAGFGWMGRNALRLQLSEAVLYRKMAEERVRFIQKFSTPRGRIYGTHEVLFADSEPRYALNVFKRNFRSDLPLSDLVPKLAAALHVPKENISTLLQSPRHNYVTLKNFLSDQELAETKRLIREHHIAGFEWLPVWERTYPQQSMAKMLIGRTSPDLKGQEGIELYYDADLRGDLRLFEAVRLGAGNTKNTVGIIAKEGIAPPEPGNDIHLTIHPKLQKDLEETLEDSIKATYARSGMAVAIDVKTGGILAMASLAVDGSHRNQPITDPFEPGSTMKIFTIGAAIEAGLVSPDDEWDCENGEWHTFGHIIHDDKPEQALTTTQVLARSSNIGTAKIAIKLGKELLYKSLQSWGFGRKTEIDFPGEDRPGSLHSLSKWDDFSFANISFGQGITTTALQLVSGLAAYGNKGMWIQPHLRKKMVSPTGQLLQTASPKQRRVVSEQTASTMKKMMRAVMRGKGTGKELDPPGYPSAGKTGTAQRVNPQTGQYDPNLWYSSMLMMAPYENPAIALGFFLEIDHTLDPSGGVSSARVSPGKKSILLQHLGAKTAGPFAKKALLKMLIALGIPKEEPPEGKPTGSKKTK